MQPIKKIPPQSKPLDGYGCARMARDTAFCAVGTAAIVKFVVFPPAWLTAVPFIASQKNVISRLMVQNFQRSSNEYQKATDAQKNAMLGKSLLMTVGGELGGDVLEHLRPR